MFKFCESRFPLLVQIANTNKPALINKAAKDFTEAFLKALPGWGLQTAAAAATTISKLSEAQPAILSEEQYITMVEAIQNATAMEDLDATTSAKIKIDAMTAAAVQPEPAAVQPCPASDGHTAAAQPSLADAAAAQPSVPGAPARGPPAPGATIIGPPIPHVSKQLHEFLHNYMTEQEWQFWRNVNASDQAAAAMAAKILGRLSLWRIPEGTYSFLAGLIRTARGELPEGEGALALARLIKNYHQQLKPKNLCWETLVYWFPENPADLPEPWRAVAQLQGATVPSKLDAMTILLIQGTPSRNTHKSIKGTKAQPAAAQPCSARGGGRSINPPLALMDGAAGNAAPPTTALAVAQPGTQQWPSQNPMAMMGNPHPGPHAGSPPYWLGSDAAMNAAIQAAVDERTKQWFIAFQAAQARAGRLSPQRPGSDQGGSPPLTRIEEVREQSPPPGSDQPQPIALVRALGASSGTSLPDIKQWFVGTQTDLGGKGAADIEPLGREDEVASEKDEDDSRPKRRRGATQPASAAEPASKANAKKKAKARAMASTGPKHPEDASVLTFPGIKKFKAKHYGNFTIYIDVVTKCFRLKKAPGTTDLEHFYFKAQSGAKAWAEMVKRLKQFQKNGV